MIEFEWATRLLAAIAVAGLGGVGFAAILAMIEIDREVKELEARTPGIWGNKR